MGTAEETSKSCDVLERMFWKIRRSGFLHLRDLGGTHHRASVVPATEIGV
jgi:hypothetical protein